MSQNICALVDLFDKAVAGGGGKNKHCENEVGTLRRDRNIASKPDRHLHT